jgi:hypothetical protein
MRLAITTRTAATVIRRRLSEGEEGKVYVLAVSSILPLSA